MTGGPARYLNISNIKSSYVNVTAEASSTTTYNITDGVHTQSASRVIPASGQWNTGADFTGMNDGPVALTVAETDLEGNPNTIAYNLIKDTAAPAGSFTIAGTVINGVTATTNPTLSLPWPLARPLASPRLRSRPTAGLPTVRRSRTRRRCRSR